MQQSLPPPCFPEAHNNRGNTPFAVYRLEESIGVFRRAIKRQPAYAKAYSNPGFALAAQRRCNEAIDYYEHALSLTKGWAIADRDYAKG